MNKAYKELFIVNAATLNILMLLGMGRMGHLR